jgi:hypothetical protein
MLIGRSIEEALTKKYISNTAKWGENRYKDRTHKMGEKQIQRQTGV